MSKHFAMLSATRRLENHLSRERYNLDRMADNDKIPFDLFEKKVGYYNGLVDALNELFASLSDSPSSKLFSPYLLEAPDEITTGAYRPVEAVGDASVEPKPYEEIATPESEPIERVSFDERVVSVSATEYSGESDSSEESQESTDPDWKEEGYETYEAWLADKEAEFVQSPDDLTLSVNDAMSRHRAQQALDEYSQTSEQDISSYLPEDDQPANVFPSDDEDEAVEGDGEINTSISEGVVVDSYDYLDHTVDNVRVDNDPTQIAAVETAVERYGENARKGTDIDVSSFLYQSEPSSIDDLIGDDIEQLHAPRAVPEDSDL